MDELLCEIPPLTPLPRKGREAEVLSMGELLLELASLHATIVGRKEDIEEGRRRCLGIVMRLRRDMTLRQSHQGSAWDDMMHDCAET